MPTRTADAEWQGNLQQGQGTMRVGSGAFKGNYSFKSRMGDETVGTNPEELIGAAHAGCFSMALSNALASAGFTPTRVHTTARVHFNQVPSGFDINPIDLETSAVRPEPTRVPRLHSRAPVVLPGHAPRTVLPRPAHRGPPSMTPYARLRGRLAARRLGRALPAARRSHRRARQRGRRQPLLAGE